MPSSAQLKRYRCFEIFSQSTGVEIRATVKNHEENGGDEILDCDFRIAMPNFSLTSFPLLPVRWRYPPGEAW